MSTKYLTGVRHQGGYRVKQYYESQEGKSSILPGKIRKDFLEVVINTVFWTAQPYPTPQIANTVLSSNSRIRVNIF